MITVEVEVEDGEEGEDEAAADLHPGEATAASERERGAEGGHRRLLMSPGAEEGLPRLSMSQGTDTRPQEAPPMTETDTSHAPGPGHPLPESVTDQT